MVAVVLARHSRAVSVIRALLDMMSPPKGGS